MRTGGEPVLIWRKAGMEDIEVLVESRIMVLRAANRLPEDADLSLVRS